MRVNRLDADPKFGSNLLVGIAICNQPQDFSFAAGKFLGIGIDTSLGDEHPAVLIDKNVNAAKRPLINAFMEYLWSDEAQEDFVTFHFYSSTNDAFNQASTQFGRIEMPFTIEYFGGWDKAYPEVIEQVFRDQVQRK